MTAPACCLDPVSQRTIRGHDRDLGDVVTCHLPDDLFGDGIIPGAGGVDGADLPVPAGRMTPPGCALEHEDDLAGQLRCRKTFM